MKKMKLYFTILIIWAHAGQNAQNPEEMAQPHGEMQKKQCSCSKRHQTINAEEDSISRQIHDTIDFYRSGCLSLPPGETPESMGLVSYNTKEVTDYKTTSVENKLNTAPTTGEYNIPVFLVGFTDMPPPEGLTTDVYEEVFNSPNYLGGEGISVSAFYKHNSYNKLNITYDIYDWAIMPQSYATYVANNHQLVVDVLNYYSSGQNQIDFSQYDSDGDNRLDGMVIVQAGYSSQQGGNGYIRSVAKIYRGMTIYNVQGLYYGNVAIIPAINPPITCDLWDYLFGYPDDCRTDISIAVHEFAHVLGLPDLYEIGYDGSQLSPGLGGHTVMALNTDAVTQDVKRPVNFDAWSKYFFGWLEPILIDCVTQANIYGLLSYDTHNQSFLLRNPVTMYEREFFLIVNRFLSDNTLDTYLFGLLIPPSYNVNGGIDILHVDENYIDYTYAGPIAFNSIMHDPDGDYYDDEISHPGIIFEQNILSGSNNRSCVDLYTSKEGIIPDCNPLLLEGKFDNIERTDPSPSCQVYRDVTSSSYKNIGDDSGIRVYGMSLGGFSILAYLTIDEPLALVATILSPEPFSVFEYSSEPILFEATSENFIGNMIYKWYSNYPEESSLFFTGSQLSATAQQLNLTQGDYTITVKVEDTFGRIALDMVDITITLATAVKELNSGKHKIYPNPATSTLFLDLQNDISQVFELRITASDGIEHFHQRINTNDDVISIDISALSPGIYILTLSNEYEIVHFRFICSSF
jgi:M6 family metalloprotease-like protein